MHPDQMRGSDAEVGHDVRRQSASVLDHWFFAFSAVAGSWFSYVLLRDGLRPGWPTLQLVVFWAFSAYLVLPRLHRVLSSIYLPGYFVGRTRTSDGLLGDPVNLGLLGREGQVHAALGAAGWTRADPLDLRSSLGIVLGVLRRRSYASAPVSPLRLFDRQQDFAYEQEVEDSPTKRHHVRFWRCPDDWLLPGGYRADWLAAATFDRRVGLSLFTGQLTHRIDADTDVERDFVLGTVRRAVPSARLSVIENFSTGYHHRNGGGDRIRTDGNLPILDLSPTAAGPDPVPQAPQRRCPSVVALGAGVAVARAVAYVGGVVSAESGDPDLRMVSLFLVAAVVDLVLAVGVVHGRNWARLLLMAACSVTAASAMATSVVQGRWPDDLASLLSSGGSILVVLALSDRAARDYALGGSSRGDGQAGGSVG